MGDQVARLEAWLDAYANHDHQTMGDSLADDAVWHVGGTHRLSGDYRGRDAILGYFDAVREATADTMRLEPLELLANERHGAAFMRVTAERDYMRLHVGKRSWLIHHSMAALEEGLDPELFVRLHRSAIVRRDFIAGFSRNASGRWIARLADGNEQPVGRLYADQVRAIAGR